MGQLPTKEKKIKRLEKQVKKHATNPKLVENFEGRIKTLKGTTKKK
jgi:hypothetical protein